MRRLTRRLHGQRGQGLSEYAIIVALIAIASIVVITAFGNQIRELFVTSGEQLAGDEDASIENRMDGADPEVGLDDIGSGGD